MTDPAALQTIFKRAQAQLIRDGSVNVKVISGSMEPIINIDDEVTVVASEDNLERFDIVVYKSERELVCHYVWHINRFVRQGDNNLVLTRGIRSRRDDYPIHRRDILGRVSSHKLSLWWKLRLLWANR